MSEEDERTLWCGNLSDKVTEELLYELFVQAGPVEMVKIPRDNDKRQRSYAFITYGHTASVEYAINIFEGTKLFLRPLTLHKKSKNGQNASPRVNNQQQQQQHNRGPQNQHQQQQHGQGQGHGQQQGGPGNDPFAHLSPEERMMLVANMQGMISQMNQQALAAGMGLNLGQIHQQNQFQNKMNRNDRSHQGGGQQKPYSRDRGGDNQQFSRDRNEGGSHYHGGGGGGGGGGRGGRGNNDRGSGGGGGGNKRRNDYRGRR